MLVVVLLIFVWCYKKQCINISNVYAVFRIFFPWRKRPNGRWSAMRGWHSVPFKNNFLFQKKNALRWQSNREFLSTEAISEIIFSILRPQSSNLAIPLGQVVQKREKEMIHIYDENQRDLWWSHIHFRQIAATDFVKFIYDYNVLLQPPLTHTQQHWLCALHPLQVGKALRFSWTQEESSYPENLTLRFLK